MKQAKPDFSKEMKADLIKIKDLLKICRKNRDLAIEITFGGIHRYAMERNKNMICMLKKERKTLRRKLNKHA